MVESSFLEIEHWMVAFLGETIFPHGSLMPSCCHADEIKLQLHG